MKQPNPTGIMVKADETHPLYKVRTQPDSGPLPSNDEYEAGYAAYKKSDAETEKNERVPLAAGQKIGVRLNLAATASAKKAALAKARETFSKKGGVHGAPAPVNHVKILTVHDSKKKGGINQTNAYQTGSGFAKNPVIANLHFATLKNAQFNVNQTERSHIANKIQKIEGPDIKKRDKTPMASIDGEYVKPKLDANGKPIPPNFSGIKLKFNPANHHLFHDEDGNAVKSATGETTAVGDDVYVNGGHIEYHNKETSPTKLGPSRSDTKFYNS